MTCGPEAAEPALNCLVGMQKEAAAAEEGTKQQAADVIGWLATAQRQWGNEAGAEAAAVCRKKGNTPDHSTKAGQLADLNAGKLTAKQPQAAALCFPAALFFLRFFYFLSPTHCGISSLILSSTVVRCLSLKGGSPTSSS